MNRTRKFLGQRLRALRKQQGWSQKTLGKQAGLSGKFIGEVERGEKSISVDSLWGVSRALRVPLKTLTELPSSGRSAPSAEAEKILALLLDDRTPGELRKAYGILRSMFAERARR